MKFSKFFLIFSIVAFLTQTCVASAYAAEFNNLTCERLKSEDLLLTRSLTNLNSETAIPCDIVQLKTLDNIDCGNSVIIPCGSIIEGEVVQVRRSFILRTDAFIDLLIRKIKTSSGCDICLQDPIKLRIVDPHYKTLERKLAQRAPVFISGPGVSIPLNAATNLGGGVVFAITVGAQAAAGFISGLVDPDIDKTRIDGAIVRAVEGTPLGTVVITADKGYDVKSPTCCYITIKLDDETRQKLLCSMQRAIVTNKSF